MRSKMWGNTPYWYPTQPDAGTISRVQNHIIIGGYGLNGKFVYVDIDHAQDFIDCLQAALDYTKENQ